MDIVVTLNHVSNVTVFVWYHDGTNGATVICDGYFVSLAVTEDVKIGFLTVDCGLKVLSLQTTQIHIFCCVRHNQKFLVTVTLLQRNKKKPI